MQLFFESKLLNINKYFKNHYVLLFLIRSLLKFGFYIKTFKITKVIDIRLKHLNLEIVFTE